MPKGHTLLGNSVWMVAASGLENLGLLILNFALIRVYGAENHGRFVYYLSIISLIRMICDAGIGAAMVKRIGEARFDPQRMLGRGIFLTALLNLPFVAVIWFYPGLFVRSGRDAFAFFALWLAFMLIQNMAVSAFNGMQKMGFTFCVSLIYETGKLVPVLYLLWAKPEFGTFLRGLNLALFSSGLAVAALLFLKTRGLPRKLGPIETVPATLRLAILLWAPNAASAVLSQAMPIIIGLGLSNTHVSYYNAIVSLSLSATVVLAPAATTFFAWTARGVVQDGTETGALSAGYFRIVGTIALGISLALLAVRDPILACYGGEYAGLQAVLGVFILAQLAEYPRYFTTPLLSAGAHSKTAMLLELGRVAAVLIATVTGMLAGRTLFAVAVSVLAAQACFGLVRILHIRKYIDFSALPGFLKILVGGIAGLAVVSLHWSPTVNVACLLGVFIVLGGAKISDFRILARIAGCK